MSLSNLLAPFSETAAVVEVLRRIRQNDRAIPILDVPSAARPALIAAVLASSDRPAFVVTARQDRADALCAAINEYLPSGQTATLWSSPDALPYEQLPFDLDVSTRRVALLDRLNHAEGSKSLRVVVAARGLTQILMPPADLDAHARVIRPGERLDVNSLLAWGTQQGYEITPLVQEPGTIARRGGIVDIFPPAAEHPIRIDLFGDEIDSIRSFNPSSQRSEQRLASVRLLPPTELPLWRLPEAARAIASLDQSALRAEVAAEWERMLGKMEAGVTPTSVDLFAPYLVDKATTLMGYLPADGLLVVDEPAAVRLAGAQIEEQAAELVAGFVANGELPPGHERPVAVWSS
ncbi:MAG: transcription-repair coupling factor, partial [Thermomicrobiales bacterium]